MNAVKLLEYFNMINLPGCLQSQATCYLNFQEVLTLIFVFSRSSLFWHVLVVWLQKPKHLIKFVDFQYVARSTLELLNLLAKCLSHGIYLFQSKLKDLNYPYVKLINPKKTNHACNKPYMNLFL